LEEGIYKFEVRTHAGVFDNWLRKKTLGPKREQTIGICMIYTHHQKLLALSIQGE
jgi:hypothetical protein